MPTPGRMDEGLVPLPMLLDPYHLGWAPWHLQRNVGVLMSPSMFGFPLRTGKCNLVSTSWFQWRCMQEDGWPSACLRCMMLTRLGSMTPTRGRNGCWCLILCSVAPTSKCKVVSNSQFQQRCQLGGWPNACLCCVVRLGSMTPTKERWGCWCPNRCLVAPTSMCNLVSTSLGHKKTLLCKPHHFEN